jgi:hypothetical protein
MKVFFKEPITVADQNAAKLKAQILSSKKKMQFRNIFVGELGEIILERLWKKQEYKVEDLQEEVDENWTYDKKRSKDGVKELIEIKATCERSFTFGEEQASCLESGEDDQKKFAFLKLDLQKSEAISYGELTGLQIRSSLKNGKLHPSESNNTKFLRLGDVTLNANLQRYHG